MKKKSPKPKWEVRRYQSHVGVVTESGLSVLSISPLFKTYQRDFDGEMKLAQEICLLWNRRMKR